MNVVKSLLFMATFVAYAAALVQDALDVTINKATETIADASLTDDTLVAAAENTLDTTVAADVADGLVETVVEAGEETTAGASVFKDGITDVDAIVNHESLVEATAEVAGVRVGTSVAICLDGEVVDTSKITVDATISSEKQDCIAEGAGGGDPHFKRWGKERDTL